MEYLHNKNGKRKHYRFYWVGNPGDQPLWTPKFHSTLSKNSFRFRRVSKKCSTITNLEEEEVINPEAIPLDVAKKIKINP